MENTGFIQKFSRVREPEAAIYGADYPVAAGTCIQANGHFLISD